MGTYLWIAHLLWFMPSAVFVFWYRYSVSGHDAHLSRNATVQILTHAQFLPLFAKVAAQQEAQQDKVRISIAHNGGMNVQLFK